MSFDLNHNAVPLPSLYFTQPHNSSPSPAPSSLSDLNALTLRHLRLKNKEHNQQILRYQSRIRYLHDKDMKSYEREVREEEKKERAERVRREKSERKEREPREEQGQAERQEQVEKEMQEPNPTPNDSTNPKPDLPSLRVHNATQHHLHHLLSLSHFMHQHQTQLLTLSTHRTNQLSLSKSKVQKQKFMLLNGIAKRKVDKVVKGESVGEREREEKLRKEVGRRGELEERKRELEEREDRERERGERVREWRREREGEYWGRMGWGKKGQREGKEKKGQLKIKQAKIRPQTNQTVLERQLMSTPKMIQQIPFKSIDQDSQTSDSSKYKSSFFLS